MYHTFFRNLPPLSIEDISLQNISLNLTKQYRFIFTHIKNNNINNNNKIKNKKNHITNR